MTYRTYGSGTCVYHGCGLAAVGELHAVYADGRCEISAVCGAHVDKEVDLVRAGADGGEVPIRVSMFYFAGPWAELGLMS